MKKAMVFGILALLIHGAAHSEESTTLSGADILKLSEGQRHWWYAGIFTGLGHAASLEPGEGKANCVLRWYFDQPEQRKKQLEQAFQQYPDYVPTSIIMLYLKRECNVFQAGD